MPTSHPTRGMALSSTYRIRPMTNGTTGCSAQAGRVRRNSQRLVLKPNDDYGGHGITIGWNVDQSHWDAAIEEALANGDYLVQERVPTARETFPALTDDGRIEFAEQLVDLDPLLFNGKVGSAFTRLSYTELANVSSGGGMVPTYIVSEK